MNSASNNDGSLLKTTLKTMAIMVGTCVVFLGTLTLMVLFVVGRAVSPAAAGASTPEAVPATLTPGAPAPATPASPRRSVSMASGSNHPI